MHKLIFCLLCIALTACSTSTLPPTTGEPGAAEPTALSATATAEPIGPVAPTAGRPAEPLPEALYTLDQGQIFRIDRDGLTRTRLTDERVEIEGYPPIATFAVGPAGELAYVVGDLAQDRLVLTGPDGADTRIRYSEMQHELSDLAWAPDGQSLVLRLLNNRQPADIPSGIYRVDLDDGALELLVADDAVDDLVNPAPTIAIYRPFAWAPDGRHLLVEVSSPFYFTCGLGLLSADGGNVTRLELPAGNDVYCGEAAWSADSSQIYFLAGPDAGPTIWRATRSGEAVEPLQNTLGLARAPFGRSDGAVQFLAIELNPTTGATFSMAVLTDSSTAPQPLRPPSNERPVVAHWAADGSGMAAILESPEGEQTLRWVPATAGATVSLPATRSGISELRWPGRR